MALKHNNYESDIMEQSTIHPSMIPSSGQSAERKSLLMNIDPNDVFSEETKN